MSDETKEVAPVIGDKNAQALNARPNNVVQLNAPPKNYVAVCVRFRCGKELKPGRRGRQFCDGCWSILPAHFQEAIRSEEDYQRARGRNGAGDHAAAMLFSAASRRIWDMLLDGNPKMREAFEAEMRAKAEAAAAKAAREEPFSETQALVQLAETAKAKAPTEKIIVLGGDE
jgi:hypothetical protein